MVFENDSISNLAHQLGFFATIGAWQDYLQLRSRIDAVTLDEVAEVAARRLAPANRTIGWFEPVA
jgi:predicted Zn-dependent peptidase